MPAGRHILAVIFDFDDTLVPDSTTKLLRSRGIDADVFWAGARRLVESGFDSVLAWLHLFLDLVGSGGPLGGLTLDDLRSFGADLERDLFPGLPEFFEDVRTKAREIDRDAQVEFYVVSGGFKDVIEGCPTVQQNMSGTYGCELGTDESGRIVSIKRAVNFTEKTRYLFEINKGLDPSETSTNPYLVNRAVEHRRIPWENMIYVGDGLTDVPCFSLLAAHGGQAYGVFNPAEESKAKRAFEDLLHPHRVSSIHSPRYGPTDDLGAILRLAVANRVGELKLSARQAGR